MGDNTGTDRPRRGAAIEADLRMGHFSPVGHPSPATGGTKSDKADKMDKSRQVTKELDLKTIGSSTDKPSSCTNSVSLSDKCINGNKPGPATITKPPEGHAQAGEHGVKPTPPPTEITAEDFKHDFIGSLKLMLSSQFEEHMGKMDIKLNNLEHRVTSLHQEEFTKLHNRITTVEESNNTLNNRLTEESNNLSRSIEENKTTADNQIKDLQAENKALKDQMKEAQENIEELQTAHNNTNKHLIDNIRYANEIDQHSRLWCLRFYGIDQPTISPEPINVTRSIIMDIVHQKLNLPHIKEEDLISVHRVGPVMEQKSRNSDPTQDSTSSQPSTTTQSTSKPDEVRKIQTIYTRFRTREIVNQIFSKKSNLKNTGIGIFEDLSPANMKHFKAILKHDSVKRAWTHQGVLLGVPHVNENVIVKFRILEDIEDSIQKALKKGKPTQGKFPKSPKAEINQQTTTNATEGNNQ